MRDRINFFRSVSHSKILLQCKVDLFVGLGQFLKLFLLTFLFLPLSYEVSLSCVCMRFILQERDQHFKSSDLSFANLQAVSHVSIKACSSVKCCN